MTSTWEFGGFAPVFNGPDASPISILGSFSGTILAGAALFTLDSGTKSYSDQGDAPVGVTFHSATGSYTAAGAVTPGTYSMVLRCLGSDTPASYADYAWTMIVNAVTNKPVFTGPIDDQVNTGNVTFDASAYFSGATSYSVGALSAGITFNTGTGIFTIVAATTGTGIFGPFTVTGTNAAGSTASNPFLFTQLIADTPGDYSDLTLQALLDPGGNFTGIRIIRRDQPGDTTKINFYVIPVQHNPGRARWVEVLATDDAAARANKIVAATTIPAQPTWPLPT